MNFSDIVGHEKPVMILQRALQSGTLAHAYLFSGDSGIGKKTTALALAAAVNCPQAEGGGGCGLCPSCRRIAAGSHPDVRLLAADGDEIKIDQIREMQADLALRPFEGRKKTLIVDGADRLNVASSNAFLKTLEEPPGDALMILVTAMPQSLLTTIRSRCQEIKFQPLARSVLAGLLRERRGLAEHDAWFLAALAQGSVGRGLAMDGEQEQQDRRGVMDVLADARAMGSAEALALSESLAKDRERFDRLLDIGVECFRDALLYRETGDVRLLVNSGAEDVYRIWNERMPMQRMLRALDLIIASRSMLERRISAQLVAENLFLNLSAA